MTSLHLWQYGAILGVTLVLTLVLTPLALLLAQRLGILDRPGSIKTQASPIPYLGGAAMVVAFALTVMAAAVYRPPVSGLSDLGELLGMAVGLAILGLIDDIRGLGTRVRFLVEVAAGVGVYVTGNATHLAPWRPLDAVLTVIWVVGVTNAFNLLDNMDGLSAGVAAIASASFFIVAHLQGQFLVAGLAVALTGCAVGFLRHNFHPARIYMGDAGALFLGFMLASLGLRLRVTHQSLRVTFFVPVLILGVALFDTALVTACRLWHRRSPVVGGLDHTSHRLVFVGVPVRAAVSLIYAGGITLGWLAVVMSRLDKVTAGILMALVASVALFLGALLAAVPVYETSRRRRLMLQEVARHELRPGPGGAVPRSVDDMGDEAVV
ncbi:MAG TPA: MraY family glycosyltransferase [Acidimicrobiales bacterium]|nr:MraY family glycosyltransferase [Acidimicrobiales bacterium]